jgi:predicted MFS family arabinose efflux permease
VTRRAGAALYALALANFAVGTAFLIIAGVLDLIARDTAVDVPVAGQLISVYALAYAVGSPMLVALTGQLNRRALMLAGLTLLAAGSALGAWAPSFAPVMCSRVIVAAGAGMVTPTASAVAAHLSSPERRGRAIALVFGGLTVAQVIGVPVGTYIGHHAGWRASMWCVVLLAALALLAVVRFVPREVHIPAPSLGHWLELARNGRLRALLAVTAMVIGAQFVPFTFIAPYLSHYLGGGGATVTALLFWFGLAAFAGNLATGRLIDHIGARRTVQWLLAAVIGALAALPAMQLGIAAALGALAVWGASGYGFNPAQQVRIIEAAPMAANVALALNASALYAGQAFGAMIGGVVLAHAGFASLGAVGAAIVAAALVIVVLSGRAARSEPIQR